MIWSSLRTWQNNLFFGPNDINAKAVCAECETCIKNELIDDVAHQFKHWAIGMRLFNSAVYTKALAEWQSECCSENGESVTTMDDVTTISDDSDVEPNEAGSDEDDE